MAEQPRFVRGIAPVFQSAEQTGGAGELTIAHGLGRTPSVVWCMATSATSTHFTLGTHDATNVKVTAVNSSTFVIYALL